MKTNNNFKLNGHSSHDGESHRIPAFAGMTQKENKAEMTQSGRSMVEMLGVLAVMGVLSVGGVAMYTNAMNKYRANELLNESSKRAVVIATQILSGKSISADMMNQFDNNGTTFTGVEAVGTNQFKLTLSGVDDDVCTQLKATVGSNTIIQEVGDKCAYLTFNNDLSKGTSSSNTNGSNGGSDQQEPVVDPCTDVICQNGGTCSAGTCDCTGTGYTGDHCETLVKMFKCGDGTWGPVSDNNGNSYGYCDKLGGCKVLNTFTEADKWSEVCNQQLQDGYYVCTGNQVFDSEGNMVKQCAEGCQDSPKSSPEDTCIGGPGGPIAPIE